MLHVESGIPIAVRGTHARVRCCEGDFKAQLCDPFDPFTRSPRSRGALLNLKSSSFFLAGFIVTSWGVIKARGESEKALAWGRARVKYVGEECI